MTWLTVVLCIVYQIIRNVKSNRAGTAATAATAATSPWWGSIVMQLFFGARRTWYALYRRLMVVTLEKI